MAYDEKRPPLENIAEAMFAIARSIDGHADAIETIQNAIDRHAEILAGSGRDDERLGALRELAEVLRNLPDSLGHELVLAVRAIQEEGLIGTDVSEVAASLDNIATAITESRDAGNAA